MKKKLMVLAAFMVASSLLLSGCGASDGKNEVLSWEATAEGDGSWDRVEQAGKIIAGLDENYPPMGSRDPQTGELVGFDIDMSNLISQKLGVPIEFVPAEWDAIVPSLTSKKFDIIVSGMNMFDDRIRAVNFVPYGVAGQVILVKADNPDLSTIKDISYFKDKKLGTQLGSTAAKLLEKEGFDSKSLALYKSYPEISIDLDNGRIDGLVIDTFGANDLIKSGKFAAALEITEGLGDEENGPMANVIGIAVRKEDGDLQRKIQKAVDELIADGSLSKLSQQWIELDITTPLQEDAKKRVNEAK